MSAPNAVAEHYTHGNLLQTIQDAVNRIGKMPETITIDDLSPVDEFHVGGRPATQHLLEQISPAAQGHLLDVGCGLGGPARFAASHYGCQVTGIDLTPEFVETGSIICQWVGLEPQVTLHQGSALELPFADNAFNGGYMLHVGMNIANKAQLFAELYRVLQPGAFFGVYDVMRIRDGAIAYPVPWATVADTSHVATPDAYKEAMRGAGFTVVAEQNRRDFALAAFEMQRKKNEEAGGPPPIGLQMVIGESIGIKMKNLVGGIAAGAIAPVEIIGRK